MNNSEYKKMKIGVLVSGKGTTLECICNAIKYNILNVDLESMISNMNTTKKINLHSIEHIINEFNMDHKCKYLNMEFKKILLKIRVDRIFVLTWRV